MTKYNSVEQAFYYYLKDKLKLYNASIEPCDILYEGPCCCGAFHVPGELPRRCGTKIWKAVVNSCIKDGIEIPSICTTGDYTLEEMEW